MREGGRKESNRKVHWKLGLAMEVVPWKREEEEKKHQNCCEDDFLEQILGQPQHRRRRRRTKQGERGNMRRGPGPLGEVGVPRSGRTTDESSSHQRC